MEYTSKLLEGDEKPLYPPCRVLRVTVRVDKHTGTRIL